MTSRGIISALTGLALIWPSPRAKAADAAEVEALIAKGNELRRARTPGPALPYFQKAYELARTPRTRGQLGLAELDAGYPVEAAEHLAAALQSPDDPSIAKYRQILADALAKARSRVGELTVEGGPPTAEVVVDGRTIGVLPLSAAIKLAARDAEVVVRAPGYVPFNQVVPLIGGQRRALTVNLQRIERPNEGARFVVSTTAPARAPVASSTAPATVLVDHQSAADVRPNRSDSTLRTSAWIVGGGAVVVAGAGLALNLAARSNRADFDSSCVNMNGIHMVSGQRLTQNDCEDRYNAWESERRWSISGYVAGAALAATSGIFFWISRPTSTTSEIHARTSCAPTPTGLSCRGLF